MATNLKSISLPAHRGGECPECDGSGVVDYSGNDADGLESLPEDLGECDDCDGAGATYWRWDPEEVDAECTDCGAKGVIVDGWGEDGEDWTCRACALRAHAQDCGCDAWPVPS